MKSRAPTFWCGLVFGGFAALGALALQTNNLANDGSTWAFILLFGGLALLMMIWEFGRHFQGAGTRWQRVKWGDETRVIYLLRGSGLQVALVALFFLFLAVGASVFSQFEAATADRFEMGIYGVAGLFTALGYGIYYGFRARGIALAPEGLLWLQERATLLVPWESIESVAQIRVPKDVGYGLNYHEPSLGIRLKPGATSQLREMRRSPQSMARATQQKLARNRSENAYDLIYSAEELIPDLANVERVIRYFLANPNRRARLGAGELSPDFFGDLLSKAGDA